MKNIAVFASGRGSNFMNIFRGTQSGEIPARIKCLVTDKKQAGAIDFARKQSIPSFSVRPGDFASVEKFAAALLEILEQHAIDWIVLAGYLKKIPGLVVERFANRILNIHPALLPAFGGKDMYGMRVHQAVFDSGARISGATVHLVNNEYDAGPIVMQTAVDIADCRSPEEVSQRVLQQEHRLYSLAIAKILTHGFRVEGNRVIFNMRNSE